MRYCLSMLAVAAIVAVTLAGCQGPTFSGGYPQGVPYRGVGVDGPGPGVIPPSYMPMSMEGAAGIGMIPGPMMGGSGPMNSVPMGAGAMPGMPMPPCPPMGGMEACMMPPVMVAPSSQIYFIGPDGMQIRWDEKQRGAFDSEPRICPATHDFAQGGIYRLKLTSIPGYAGKELYPTLEVTPTMARTQAFLAHNTVPIEFTPNDFDQALSGNFVTKVVYLPNPEYQGLAMAGVGTLVNTQLEAGVDPIVEAGNRGAILAVIRLGNKDLNASAAQKAQMAQSAAGQMIMGPMGQPMMNAPMMGAPMMPGMGMEPMQGGFPVNGSSIPQNAISGVNIPRYGTPMTKTSTGIPGPPQLPQGQHANQRYPVLRAEPIPVPPSVGSTLVQPQPVVGMQVAPMYLDPRNAPHPQLMPR